MNTVLVPVDFSETSFTAARYAAKLFTGHPEVELILYHTFEDPDAEENRIESLEKLKEELTLNRNINISVLAEQGEFLPELEKLSRHREADLIVMGIKGKSSLVQAFIGSNALKMAANKFCPVMIIPSNAEFSEIKNILLATDLKNVVSTTPTAPIKKILATFNAKLHIVNVNSEHYIALTEEHAAEQQKLREMFSEFDPEFYFLRLYDIDEAINQFAEDKNIDLIITINKDHSLVHKLFIVGHTKKLAFHSRVPVLAVHE